MAQPPQGLTVQSVLSRTFAIWSKNFVAFTLLALVVQVPAILFALFWPITGDGTIYQMGIQFLPTVLGFVTAGAVAYGVFQQLRGQTATVSQCLSVGLSRLGAVVVVAILVAVMVFVGFLLLIVPGVILSLIFAVAIPVAVVEGAGVGEALRRSAFLTKGNRGQIFLINLVFGLIIFAITFVLTMAIVYSQGTSALETGRFTPVVTVILSAILGALQAVAMVIIYYELRSQKELVDLEKIAAVFA